MRLKYLIFVITTVFAVGCSISIEEKDNFAIGDIEFGITKDVYLKKIDSLLNTLESDREGVYNLGFFKFDNIAPEFDQNKFIAITLSGYTYNSFSDFKEALRLISNSLSEKYGNTESAGYDVANIQRGYTGSIPGPSWGKDFKTIGMSYLIKSDMKTEIILRIENVIDVMNKNHKIYMDKKNESDRIKELL